MRTWITTEGGELRYERDLPYCCRRNAVEKLYECPLCGVVWQRVEPVEPVGEEINLMQNRQRKGAA